MKGRKITLKLRDEAEREGGVVLHVNTEHGKEDLVSYIARVRETLLKPLEEESRV